MGFFDDMRKSWSAGYTNGKANSEKQNKWKKEELEYKGSDDKVAHTIEALMQGIDVARLYFEKKEIDLRLKYGENTNAERSDLYAQKADIRKQLEELKRPSSNDEEGEIEDFVERYNAHRDKRAALCISYMQHSRATELGIILALKILLKSPYSRNMEEVRADYFNLKERMDIYKQQLKREESLTALDYCFFNHLVTDTEIIPIDSKLSEQWSMNMLTYVTTCRNTVRYNDEMYRTHLSSLSFYKLSTFYSEQVEKMENDILSEVLVLYIQNENN